jgi:hypothetical protein
LQATKKAASKLLLPFYFIFVVAQKVTATIAFSFFFVAT